MFDMEPRISSKFSLHKHSPTQCRRVWSHVFQCWNLCPNGNRIHGFMVRISTTLPSTGKVYKPWPKLDRNEQGPGYPKHFEVVSLSYQSCWLCWQSFGTSHWQSETKRDLLDPFILGYNVHNIQMFAKHSLEFQAHQILMWPASGTFFQLSLAVNLRRHRKPMSPFHLTKWSRSAAKPIADAQINGNMRGQGSSHFFEDSLDAKHWVQYHLSTPWFETLLSGSRFGRTPSWWTGRNPFWAGHNACEMVRKRREDEKSHIEQLQNQLVFHIKQTGSSSWKNVARISVNSSNIEANRAQVIYLYLDFPFGTFLRHPRSHTFQNLQLLSYMFGKCVGFGQCLHTRGCNRRFLCNQQRSHCNDEWSLEQWSPQKSLRPNLSKWCFENCGCPAYDE